MTITIIRTFFDFKRNFFYHKILLLVKIHKIQIVYYNYSYNQNHCKIHHNYRSQFLDYIHHSHYNYSNKKYLRKKKNISPVSFFKYLRRNYIHIVLQNICYHNCISQLTYYNFHGLNNLDLDTRFLEFYSNVFFFLKKKK